MTYTQKDRDGALVFAISVFEDEGYAKEVDPLKGCIAIPREEYEALKKDAANVTATTGTSTNTKSTAITPDG